MFTDWVMMMLDTEPSAEFTVPLKEVQSVEGQTVEMTCELSRPGQQVTWLKDGVELVPDDRCAILVDGCQHRLIINNATLEDEAEYTVKLTDDVSSKATLWVEGAPGNVDFLSDHKVVWGRLVYCVLVHGQVTFIFVVSVCLSACLFVCLSVCLCRVFLSRLRSDLDRTRTHVTCPVLVVSARI